ncbi:hypothetical protein [Curtobacterium sp. UCD-KPL2560]|uniref:hypothetical protein n=1 Tax=Curtobacterium sp. UCD-KPL2560 TaxID=1885315 RepID=UPI000826E575|nr:hypothetical protein [Curtobacterium sp. UCD-KPL2560]
MHDSTVLTYLAWLSLRSGSRDIAAALRSVAIDTGVPSSTVDRSLRRLHAAGWAPMNPNGTERTDAGEYLAEYPLIAPLQSIVYERKAYRDVIGEGLGVVEWNNPKARSEVQELAGEVIA